MVAFTPIGPTAHAAFELSPHVFLQGCDWASKDAFDFSPMLNTLKEQLATKIEGKTSCQASIQSVYQNFNGFHRALSTDSSLKQKIAQDFLQNYLNDLNSQKTALEIANQTTSSEYPLLLSSISTIETRILDNQIDLAYNTKSDDEFLDVQLKSQLVSHTKNILSTLNQTWQRDPRCFDQLNLADILPATLQIASLTSGIQGMGQASVIGEVLSGVTLLFSNKKIQKAYNDIIRLNNNINLSCVYFAALKNTCEYRRGIQLSEKKDKIDSYVQRIHEKNDPLYKTWANINERKRIFNAAFNQVASSASGLLTDIQQLSSYFTSKRSDPETLPAAPADSAGDDERITWLNLLDQRGVDVPRFDNAGNPFTPVERVKRAIEIINTQKSTIIAIENSFKRNRNFTELRNYLEVITPTIRNDTKEVLNLIETFSGIKKDEKLIDPVRRGPLFSAMKIFAALDEFLNVPIENFDDFDNYNTTMAKKGGTLYEQMTYNSIGAINSQVLLVLGSKATERFENSLAVIRNYLLERDEQIKEDENKFSTYLRDKAMLAFVIQNYKQFQATGPTFRGESADTFFKSFEKGMRKEIFNTLDIAFNTKRESIPETTGRTAAQMCALYSYSLKNMGEKGLKYLKKCQENFKELQLYSIVEAPHNFMINYNDDCTYIDYTRRKQMEEVIVNLKLGI